MDGMRRMPPNRSFEMKKVVVFTGAGVSADSGLSTFRDADGLWADYRIEDVCTPEALARNRRLVIEFYNKRRREMLAAEPNAGHRAIAELERDFEVEVLTQKLSKNQTVTEELKQNDPLQWTKEMNRIYQQAEEIVLKELVYQ